MYPFVKTGGLGDIVGSLPKALLAHGINVTTILPGYPAVMSALMDRECVSYYENVFGHAVTLWRGTAHGHDLFVVDAPDLFDRPGNPYMGPDGRDWPDNAVRYAVFSRVVAWVAQGRIPGFAADLVQAHDWQTGLVPAYLYYDGVKAPPSVMTIHNLAFQGIFPASLLERFGLPPRAMSVDGVEYYGQIGFLKAGLQLATELTTVSPTYALEIQTPEHGMGLDGLLRSRSDVLHGILNGIDIDEWNPESDPSVVYPFEVGDIVGRRANKRVFQAEFGLPQDPDAFLLGIVSRLTTQKGADLLADILPRVMQDRVQLVVVGTGDHQIMRSFIRLQTRFPAQLACHLRYSERLGHRLHGAVDASLIPSRFEPCGLTQFHALRYGSVPIAARVGGLSDTLVDANTAAIAEGVANGILFSPTNQDTLYGAIRQAHSLFRQKAVWGRLQRNGGLHDVSWHGKAAVYARLFQRLAGHDPKDADLGDDIAPRRGDLAGRAGSARAAANTRVPGPGRKGARRGARHLNNRVAMRG